LDSTRTPFFNTIPSIFPVVSHKIFHWWFTDSNVHDNLNIIHSIHFLYIFIVWQMYGMNNIKFTNARQAKEIYQYKNIKQCTSVRL
jgi:hypothetical protein